MKISITKKIDLGSIIKHVDWEGMDMWIEGATVRDIKEFTKQDRTISKQIARHEREIEKIKKGNQEDPATIQAIEEIEEKIAELSEERLDSTIKVVQEKFRKGYGFDSETNSKQELTKEDLSQFSIEILGAIVREIMGSGEKKS